MPQAPSYKRKTNFTNNDGDETDHSALNSELDAASQSIDGLRTNLAKIQRDDGALVSGVVTKDSISETLFNEIQQYVAGNIGDIADEVEQNAQAATLAAVSANNSKNETLLAKQNVESLAAATASNAGIANNSAAEANSYKNAAAASANNAGQSAINAGNSAAAADAAKNQTQVMQEDVGVKHANIVTVHNDVVAKHGEVLIAAEEVEDNANDASGYKSDAAASAAAAAASAAGINLPPVSIADAGRVLRVNPTGTGYDVTSHIATNYGIAYPFQSRAAAIAAGAVLLSGAIWSGDVYVTMWERLLAGHYSTCTEAEWQAGRRGCYVINLAQKTFRCPDLNGDQPGSVAQFLRGDGNRSVPAGHQKADQFQGHKHRTPISQSNPNPPAGNWALVDGLEPTSTASVSGSESGNWYRAYTGAATISDGVNGIPRVGSETAPYFTSVVWATFFGDVAINYADVDIAALHSQYVLLNNTLSTLNSSIDFTILYPNGGSAATPANVTNNSRYVLPHPFPTAHVMCAAQVLYNGNWGYSGWQTDTAGQGYGSSAGALGANIILQTGTNAVLSGVSANNGGVFGLSTSSITTLPCRILVWKVKG